MMNGDLFLEGSFSPERLEVVKCEGGAGRVDLISNVRIHVEST